MRMKGNVPKITSKYYLCLSPSSGCEDFGRHILVPHTSSLDNLVTAKWNPISGVNAINVMIARL
jgi:hypothetical protein